MAKSLDSLIEFLLEEIALCGEKGASRSDILAYLQEFYDVKPIRSTTSAAATTGTENSSDVALAGDNVGQNDHTTTVSNDRPINSLRFRERQNLDAAFQAKVWKWLTAHPDVRIHRIKSEQKRKVRKHERNVNARPDQGLQTKHQTTTGLKDSVRETPAISVKDAANLPLTNSSQTENKPKKVHKSQLLRLRVTEERIWIALTGHGVNHSRCPRMEFACLSVIASRRYDGIVQPELTRVTGQDKRSLPRRTDSLAKKGYIEKTLAFTRGQRTSHLILRRYANRKRPQQFSTTDGKGSNEGHQSSTGQRTWGGDFLRPSIAVRSLVAEVKNHSVITQADLKWKLGLSETSWQLKLFQKVLRKLELIGCIQRISAQAEVAGVLRNFPSVKFIREPEDHEWELTWGITFPGAIAPTRPAGGDAVEADNNQEVEVDDSHCIEQPTTETMEGQAQTKALQKIERPLLHWKPKKPVANMIFNIVDAAGTDGISTMASSNNVVSLSSKQYANPMKSLKACAMGPFYQRPIDAALDHISQNVNQSQLPHLRHLAIIRDTAQSKKTCHYQYFTYDNFQRLVDQGKTSWDSVVLSGKESKKKSSKGTNAPKETIQYDEYGFPILPDSLFLDKEGCATLSESVAASGMTDLVYTTYDPVICQLEDGTLDVDWGDSMRRVGRPAKRDSGRPKKILSTDVPRKPRGRPRKYPKGQEPYRKGKGRKNENVEQEKAKDSADERAEQQLQTEASLKRTAEEAGLEGDHPQETEPTASGATPKVKARGRPRKRQKRGGLLATNAPARNSKRTADEADLTGVQSEIVASTDNGLVPDNAASSRAPKRQKQMASTATAAPTRAPKRKQVKTNQAAAEIETTNATGPVANSFETNETVPQASLAEPPSINQAITETPGQQSTKRKRTKTSKVAPTPSEETNDNFITETNQRKSLVTILPPGPRPGSKKRGRPRKSKIVVFKFEGLRSFSWFNNPDTVPAEGSASNDVERHVEVQTTESSTTSIVNVSQGGHQDTRTTADHDETPQNTTDRPELDDDTEPPLKKLRLQEANSRSDVSHQSTRSSVDNNGTTPKRKNPSEPGNSSEPSSKKCRLQNTKSKGASEPRYSSSSEPVLSTAQASSEPPPTAAEDQHADSNGVTVDSIETSAVASFAAANEITEQTATDVAVVPSAETNNVEPSEAQAGNLRMIAVGSPPAGEQTMPVPDVTIEEPRQAQVSQTQTSKGSYQLKKSIMKAGTVNFKRKRIIMELVDRLGGVYPGDKELWYPFSVIWMKENPGSGRPDYRTLLNAQKALVDSGQLKMFKFCYTNSKGLRSEKKILARMEINANSPLVKDLEQKLKGAGTNTYIPPEAGVSVEAKKVLDLKKSNGSRQESLPKMKIIRDTTAKLTLLRSPPPLPSLTPEQQKRAEERGLQKKQKEERRMQRLVGKANKEMIKLSMNEKREAARQIRVIAKAPPQSGADDHGPPRVARLHGLYRRDDPQEIASAPTSGPHVTNVPLASVGIQSDKDALKRRALFSLYYKLQRTGLNASKQTFHSASGTFGTFFSAVLPTKRESKKETKRTSKKISKKISKKPSQAYIATLPSSLEEIIAQTESRGLVSQNSFAGSAPGRSRFENEVDTVSMWEKHTPKTTEQQSSSWSFINHTFSEPHIVASAIPKARVRTRTTTTKAKAKASRPRAKRLTKSKKFMTRTLTAPPDRVSENGTPGSTDPAVTAAGRRKRRPRGQARITAKSLTETELQKLLTAVTVIRTLTGGIDRNIDWVIVARLFTNYDHAVLKKSWAGISASYKVQLEKLQNDFQKAFLTAYAAGDVPSINYDHLVDYDWEWLVNWAIKNLEIPDSRSLPDLPATRKWFDELFEVRNDPEPHHPWRDDYFGISTPLYKRAQLAGENTLSAPLVHSNEQESNGMDEEVQLAKTWIRANVLTSQEVYKPELAKEKLMTLDEDCLGKALNELTSTRIVRHANKGRSMPGRNYDITDQYLNSFKKTLDEPRFNVALAYKAKMDEAFKKPGGSVPFTYYASDGESLALLNLIAHKRVRLVPRNVPMNRFGLMDGSYRTRFMDKSRLHFEMDVVATDDYIFGNPLLSSPLPPAPRPDDHDGRPPIPVWYDIHGNFVPVMWKKVLMAVMSVVSMRTGINLKELRRCLKPSVEEWELKLVMKWLVEIKAVRGLSECEIEGWAVGEWWWMVIDTVAALTGGVTASTSTEVEGGRS